MSRLIALIPLALFLAACQPAVDSTAAEDETALVTEPATLGEEPAANADADDSTCNADPVQALVGQTISDALIEQALKDSGAEVSRVLKTNEPATLELNQARLNLITDDNGVIQMLHCG